MSLHKVFVYGTLKKGEPNHYWMTDTSQGLAKFVGVATTVEKYPLIIATKYNIPFLLDAPGRGHNVAGEVYEVDDAKLTHLDVLEDHPVFYQREIHPIQLADKNIDCWVYLLKKFKPELLQRETFENYSSYGSHGLPYGERSNLDPSSDVKLFIKRGFFCCLLVTIHNNGISTVSIDPFIRNIKIPRLIYKIGWYRKNKVSFTTAQPLNHSHPIFIHEEHERDIKNGKVTTGLSQHMFEEKHRVGEIKVLKVVNDKVKRKVTEACNIIEKQQVSMNRYEGDLNEDWMSVVKRLCSSKTDLVFPIPSNFVNKPRDFNISDEWIDRYGRYTVVMDSDQQTKESSLYEQFNI